MNEREIFDLAKKLSGPDRLRFLELACAGNPDLRQQVELLLQAHDGQATVLQESNEPTDAGKVDATFDVAPDRAGSIIAGKYKLLEPIGEGGMGKVWMAEQRQPVKRLVAVKLIKPGLDSKAVFARFEAERQALALMDHPNIARILDGGITTNGSPFFVMELVKGVAITEYCDSHRLTPKQRLELFIPVCQAIQHAHQKGVIHRDIKPSNVMVSTIDDRPIPKVIDFGVAKATGQALTEQTLNTGFNLVGTPQYMSPEQATLHQLDIDTRTDIYSLGVLLYELLAGAPPFKRKELERAGYLEILRVIREDEPPRPSTKLSTAEGLPSLSASRSTEPRKLTGLLRNELDWIVMKALEKDRARRYETANGFAADINRYLAGEPVLAHPPSASYRIKKFLRKNRAPVIAASLISLALLGGIMGTTWGMFRAAAASKVARQAAVKAEAARARTRAALDEVSSEAIETLLSQQQELSERHKAFLRRALEYYSEFAAESGTEPQTRADIARAHLRMGNIRTTLGELGDSQTASERAIEMLATLAVEFPDEAAYRDDLAKSHVAFGLAIYQQGDRAGAEGHFRMAVNLLEPLKAQFPDQSKYQTALAKVHVSLANVLADRAARQDAETGYLRAIELLETIPTQDVNREMRMALANARYNLALLLDEQGKPNESEAEYLRSIEVNEELVKDYPQDHDILRRLSSCLINLSELVANREAWDDAEQLLRRGLEIQEQLSRDYPAIPEYQKYLGRTLGSLAGLLEDRGKLDAAREIYQKAVDVKQRLASKYPTAPDYQRDLGSIYNNFAFFEVGADRPSEAEAGFRRALTVQEPLVRDHPTIPEYRQELGNSYGNLGSLLLEQKKFADADPIFRQALGQHEALFKQFPSEFEYLLYQGADEGNIAESLAAQGKTEDSLSWFNRALEHMQTAQGKLVRPSDDVAGWLLNTTRGRASVLEQKGQLTAALADWEQVLQMAPRDQKGEFRLRRALCLAQSGKPEEAVADAESVIVESPDGPRQLWAARVCARAAEASPPRAEAFAARSLELLRAAEASKYFDSAEKIAGLAEDPHLASLRSHPSFQEWSQQLTNEK